MLINKTTGKIVTKKIKICKGLQKAIGLMFHKKSNSAFIFSFNRQQNVMLHTFFVFFPIYVLFLDAQKKVIYKREMKPFIVLGHKAKYIIEFTSKRNFDTVHVGHKLSW
jgi:uncharacterized membrane protein (UPF0127 family)